MDAKKRERIDAQVMTALNRGITSRKSISQTTVIDDLLQRHSDRNRPATGLTEATNLGGFMSPKMSPQNQAQTIA